MQQRLFPPEMYEPIPIQRIHWRNVRGLLLKLFYRGMAIEDVEILEIAKLALDYMEHVENNPQD
ncbi:MAG: hypothetical protein NZ482_10105 [Gloeomargarita sp. SKYG98]|nr:hypothetical protein [Gloeomargarita sp. SKYG98]